jgi:hypothetical protein
VCGCVCVSCVCVCVCVSAHTRLHDTEEANREECTLNPKP